eukprot:518393_1
MRNEMRAENVFSLDVNNTETESERFSARAMRLTDRCKSFDLQKILKDITDKIKRKQREEREEELKIKSFIHGSSRILFNSGMIVEDNNNDDDDKKDERKAESETQTQINEIDVALKDIKNKR